MRYKRLIRDHFIITCKFQLKDRLESLIVGGHYPFARVEQKSYAIADPDGNKEEKDTDKQVGTWIRANFPSVSLFRTVA